MPVLLSSGRTKKIVSAFIISTLIFLTMSAFLDLWSSRNLREISKSQFNEEQLVIARNIKWNIEQELDLLRKEMELASGIPAGAGEREIRKYLEKFFLRTGKDGVFRISLYDLTSGSCSAYDYSHQWKTLNKTPAQDFDISVDKNSATLPFDHLIDNKNMVIFHLVPSSCLLAVELDISTFLARFLRETRSGKTGYAWIINQEGIFLYHPFIEFIGKSAFTARDERNPDISHNNINFIQKNNMLKGLEGTGVYTTGWHRGITGQIEKLIAYAPVSISLNPVVNWSAAVVAPSAEIDEYINRTSLWRFFLHAIIILIIVLAGTAILFNEMRWNRELENIIKERTSSLRRSEEKYRSLVESAEDFIYTLNREGALVSMNSFTAAFFGGYPDDFKGKDIQIIFPESTSGEQRVILDLVYRHGKSVRKEFYIETENNKLWLNINFMPIRDESGKVDTVLCIARDVTREKNMELQMINAEKLASIGTLAAGVAHEVNNPLGVILGFTDDLIRKSEKGTRIYDDLKIIERQGMHCKQVVENLLRFARFGENRDVRADINNQIRDILNIVAHTLEMENIEIRCDLDEDIPMVKGDPGELQQVLLNLINNAGYAMKGGGTLTVTSRLDRKENRAVIDIRDTGTGISVEDMDRIFEPFYTTKPEGEGTGLGLAIVYGIVTKHGGTIECHSISVDSPLASKKKHGTLFKLKLPVYEKEQ
ncbi:MAG: ATP-binding protein [Desulfobacteraceae bacterium]|jgi:PAS domain S-box-containing protein